MNKDRDSGPKFDIDPVASTWRVVTTKILGEYRKTMAQQQIGGSLSRRSKHGGYL
jgi:chromosome segregation and condensation protein ScpB